MSEETFWVSTWFIVAIAVIGIIMSAKSCVVEHLNIEREIKIKAAEEGCVYIQHQDLIFCQNNSAEAQN